MELSDGQKLLLVYSETEALALTLLKAKVKKNFNKSLYKIHPDLFSEEECQLLFRFEKNHIFRYK